MLDTWLSTVCSLKNNDFAISLLSIPCPVAPTPQAGAGSTPGLSLRARSGLVRAVDAPDDGDPR